MITRSAGLAVLSAMMLAVGCGGESGPGSVGGGGTGATGGAGGTGGSGATGGSGGEATGGAGGSVIEEPELLVVAVRVHDDVVCIQDPCNNVPRGYTLPLSVRLIDVDGQVREDVAVRWSSADEAIATVDQSGLVKGLRTGSVDIVAEAGSNDLQGSLRVSITPGIVLRIEIVEQNVAVAAGESVQLSAIAYDEWDEPIDDAVFSWFVGNPLLASVDEQGVATGIASGSTVVQVAADTGTATGWTRLDVTTGDAPPAPFALTVAQPGGCGLDAAGQAFCWGYNHFGEMGVGRRDPGHVHFPFPEAVHTEVRFRSLHKGRYKTCGVDLDGLPWCWGTNARGQIGISLPGDAIGGSMVPAPVYADTVTELTLGGSHSCAISTEGDTYCWGMGQEGALGNGTTVDQWTPMQIEGFDFVRISAGESHTCAIDSAGAAWCWGDNSLGNLGNAAERDGVNLGDLLIPALEPSLVVGGHTFVEIDAANHTCGITTAGETWCWGHNMLGHLADSALQEITTPIQVPTDIVFVQVEAGNFHTCGRTAAGEAWCWGLNEYGQLGDGTLVPSRTPVRVDFDLPFERIEVVDSATCGVVQGGGAYCWGSSAHANLGGGFTPGVSAVPWPVAEPLPVEVIE
ncbi:Ig-like domain-containing protein [Vulgatibacter sp.]|uniref:RCC1 domain-containing protein n=1 Tax=Vulgatibacter sp. TaxID=1971226 RepID=UPI0035622E7E